MSAEVDVSIHDVFSKFQNQIKKKLQELLAQNYDSNAIEKIAIIPTIMSPKFAGFLTKERKLFSWKRKTADIRLKIDYQKFIEADDEEKKQLILQNILEAIRIVKAKVKKGFDGDRLEADIKKLFSIKSP